MEPNAKNCPSSSISQSTYTPSNAVTKFRFVLSPGARDVLESLIMEACLLEINVPQTRWLWQLHLASDPEADVGGGAYPPPLARAEEEKMKRRFLRHLNRVKCGGKRRRQARQNSDSTTEEGSVDSENEMVASGVRGERNTEEVSPSHSDTASTLCSTRSTSDRQAYGQFETRRSNSSSRLNEMTTSRPRSVTNRPHDGTVRRKPYRPRGGVTVGTVSRRHDLTHEKRFQATKKRRSLNRPVLSSTAGGRFGVHYPSARYMNMKLYRQRLVSINQNSGATEARLRYTRFTSSEGPVRSRRPRRGVAADRVTYRIPETPYTSDSEDSSVAAEEAHYRGPSESNAVEQRARQTAGPPRRRRMGRSNVFQSSRPSRRMPRDRNEMDETLLNRKRGRRQSVAVGAGGIGWPAPEANTMGTESDSESTAPDRSDECAARPCENPRTGTVEWIACDGCGRWFHQLCVGIRHRSQVPEVYECPRCSRISSLQVRDILSVHRERVRDRRMRNLPALNAPASSIASSTHAVSTTQPGPLSMTAAPPMRMREFHYSDNARARSSHLSYMAVQRPIGWNASTTPNTLLGSVRSSTDLLHTISRIRTSSTHHHLAMGSGPIPYEHVTERPLAAAVADQWVADYPHSPGTDELDSSVTDPTHGTAESVRSEGGSRISDPIVHTPQTSHSDELTEAAPYDTRMNVPDSLQTASKGPTEVLLEAIEVLSGAVDSNCSPETTT
ncbi:Lysine-specific demethylase 5C [Fasciola hepatica]|uniref:Lysine-specific demethylase 5C n=1 Tax=Fasciola hepatica TaxID=6192 RepID=A0A4E0RSW1_FASHE|nr:Lysine-specific demethylase 5C [Fasciola hepatica]